MTIFNLSQTLTQICCLLLVQTIIGVNSTCMQPFLPDANFLKSPDELSEESQFILPDTEHGYKKLVEIPHQFRNITYEEMSGPTTCNDFRYQMPYTGYAHYSRRATCAWYFRRNVDNNRVPREMIEAKCACKCCGYAPDHSCRSRRSSKCKEIYRYVKVLRRWDCDTTVESVEPIAVGCTCVESPPARSQRNLMPF